ncbi:MAG: hypothetical protein AUK63_756 [bacterium P3]|nr:MAG: hypothetical protein AUK63_756 [bacterium P3]KWW41824.1 MAG: hypothetical protein F083_752 [bacterium F083]
MAATNEHHISDLLSELYRQNDMSSIVDVYQVRSAYKQVVGELIARLTQSLRFESGNLYVRLHSAALRHEMSMRQQSLMDKINELLGRNVVQRIVFQ